MGLTQVSTDGVKNDAITKTKIPANQIEASELADNAVDTNAIADQAVALSKLPHGDSNNNGKFLRANNGADPTFESLPASGVTVSNNAADRVITGDGTNLDAESNVTINSDGDLLVGRTTTVDTSECFGIKGPAGDHCTFGITTDGTTNLGIVTFNDNDANFRGRIQYQHSTDSMQFHTNGSNERMRILSGGGITFNGDTSTDNALDDYERGTFSPLLKRLMTNGTTETNFYNHTHRQGVYVKIGKKVWITGRCHWSGGATGSGSLILTSLPFTVDNTNSGANEVPLVVGYRSGLAYTNVTGYAVPGLNRFMVMYFDNNGTHTLSPGATSSSGSLYFAANYEVA